MCRRVFLLSCTVLIVTVTVQFAEKRLRTGALRAFLRHRFTVGFQGLHDERLRRAAPAQPGCSCQLATPLPRAIRSSATRRVGGAHAPAAQACYGIGRQGCNTLVYVRARLEGDPTLRLSIWEDLVITGVSMCE